LSRVPKAGGVGETLAESREKVWGIAVDTDTVYWSSPFDTLRRFDRQTYAIREVALRGYRVALDDVFVYLVWKGVWRIPKTLDAPVPLADSGDQGIALDETFVYFSSWSPGGVHRVPKAGGPVQTLLDAGYCSYVAVFGDSVYVSVQGSPSGVYVVPKQGGTSTMIAPAAIPYGIAADSDGVYWTEWLNGKVWMLPTGDSSPIPVATGQEYPRDLAVDERAIYWTNDANTSAVSKVAKP
jgi:hypothetical protein